MPKMAKIMLTNKLCCLKFRSIPSPLSIYAFLTCTKANIAAKMPNIECANSILCENETHFHFSFDKIIMNDRNVKVDTQSIAGLCTTNQICKPHNIVPDMKYL